LISTILFLAALTALGGFAAAGRAQQNVAGHANNFSSVEYFDPPHQQHMKSRLSGAEARPQAGGRLLIQDLKLEIFYTNGARRRSSRRRTAFMTRKAAWRIRRGTCGWRRATAIPHVEGDGFLWRGSSSLLTISNNVRTVIEKTPETKAGL